MGKVFVPTDASYVHHRHVGPFAAMYPMDYLGCVMILAGFKGLGRAVMYPFPVEHTVSKTDAYMLAQHCDGSTEWVQVAINFVFSMN